jgi:hypothetical protein
VQQDQDGFHYLPSPAELGHLLHELLISDPTLLERAGKPFAEFGELIHQDLGVPITAKCPIECLGLSRLTVWALARGESPWPAPESVADLTELYRAGRLRGFEGIGSRRRGEIETALVFAGVEANSQHR